MNTSTKEHLLRLFTNLEKSVVGDESPTTSSLKRLDMVIVSKSSLEALSEFFGTDSEFVLPLTEDESIQGTAFYECECEWSGRMVIEDTPVCPECHSIRLDRPED